MVGAADAALLIAAKEQRHPAVGTEFVNQADLAFGVAKSQQPLAQNLHALLRAVGVGNFTGRKDWHPVAAHQVAHGGAGAGSG